MVIENVMDSTNAIVHSDVCSICVGFARMGIVSPVCEHVNANPAHNSTNDAI
jgi:hypothetical protein